ncbi:MAG: hypothetical protein WBK28_00385 [Minisyncoccia bacterium]
MRTLKEWENLFVDAIHRKYGSSSQEKRFAYISQELEDISIALKVEKGELLAIDHKYKDPDERIAGLLANVFVLANQRGTDLEKELQQALDWFQDPNTRASSDD